MNLPYNFLLFKEIFFPRHCGVCYGEIQTGGLCPACRESFLLQKKLFWGSTATSWQVQRHWELELTAQELLYDGLLLYRYEGKLKELLHAIKFENRGDLLPLLQEETHWALHQGGPWVQHWLNSFDVITCIPTSEDRLWRRGFDVPSELFYSIGAMVGPGKWGVPILKRVKRTAPLYELGPQARKTELAGCFRFNSAFFKEPKYRRDLSQGPSVLLCDDIVTTYGTVLEAARTLLEAGAQRVSLLSFSAAKYNW